ncbi:MAG: hypothetical protein KF718_31895 [Polyangiaceae bacterium]|nr:hypothetical protein [Polyangiaceae bacterium]
MDTLRMFPYLVACAAAFGLAGCPGSLADPERFLEAGAATCPPGTDVEKEIFAPLTSSGKTGGCASSLCHDADEPAAGLDLITPGIAGRVLGTVSTGSINEGLCDGEVLVDPTDPESSLFIEKVTLKTPRCGDRMPLAAPLSKANIDCVRQWVLQVAGGADGGAGTGGGGGSDASSTGGSSGAAGDGG